MEIGLLPNQSMTRRARHRGSCVDRGGGG
jgi:hypothetical protein